MVKRRACGRWRLLLSAIALPFVPTLADAQVRVELEPALGVYAGLSSFTRPSSGAPFDFGMSLSQRTAVALGGQVTAWLGERVGVRVSGFTAASEVGPDNQDLLDRQPVPANVTTWDLDALVALRPFASNLRVFFSGGVAFIERGGDAYEGFQGTSDIGGALGVGSQYRLTDRLSLQADIRTVLYQLQLTGPTGLAYPSAFQTDLLAVVGLTIKLAPEPEE